MERSVDNKVRISLSSDLRKKYGIRSFPIATGDIVTVRTGSRKGEGGKVAKVNHKNGWVSIDGITISKGDGKQEEYFLPANILKITKLDLSNPGRLQKIRELASRKNIVVEEEPEPEPEPVEEALPEEGEAELPEPEGETNEEDAEEEEAESKDEPAEVPEEAAESTDEDKAEGESTDEEVKKE